MTTPKPLLITCVAVCLWAASGCTLVTDFSLEGVACHPVNNPCLEGFGCVDGACVAGADAGVDCAACPTGECLPDTRECRPPSCDERICAAGYRCEIVEDVPTCRSVPEGQLGQFCFADADCRRSGDPAHQNRVCMRGAVQLQTTGRLRSGVCVEPCGAGGTCTTQDATCRTFELGAGTGITQVCLPPTALVGCKSDEGCVSGQLICTLFDHAAIGPITVCDQPLAQGAANGAGCAATPEMGALCANGLCIPQGGAMARPTFCGELCDEGTCSLGTCKQVPFAVESIVRYVPMCVADETRCGACGSDPALCGADAPQCTTLAASNVCLGACTSGAPGAFQCPGGFVCQTVGTSDVCVPDTGVCP